MRHRFPLLIAVASLAIGAAAGLGAARALGGSPELAQVALEAELGNAASTLRALESLRSGEVSQATETLEAALSLNVVVLDEFIRELDPPDQGTAIKLLRSIATYRAHHEYVSSERAADQHVRRILAEYAGT